MFTVREGLGNRGMESAWGEGKVHLEVWWGSLKERDYLKDLDVGGRILLNWFLTCSGEHGLD